MSKYYPTSEYTSMMRFYKWVGFSPTKKIHYLATFMSIFWTFSGIAYYFSYVYYKDVYHFEEMAVMEAMHWGTFFIGQITVLMFMLKYKEIFIEIDRIITSGFYDYEEDFTDEMFQIRQDTNDFVVRANKLLYFSLITGTVFSFTKNTVFQAKEGEYNVIYHGYVPFELTNGFRYSLVICLNLIHAFLSGIIAILGTTSFLAVCYHLCAQIRILNLAITIAVEEKDEEKSLKKLRKCIIHHIEIKRFYELCVTFFGKIMGVVPVYSVVLICTFLYDITDPNSVVGANVLVFVPELFFIGAPCYCGEQMTEMSDGMCTAIYSTLWYERPVKVRKRLLTMMVACTEPMSIKGFDVLPFSLAGLNEVLKTGYTFFNGMNAARTLENNGK